jgi:hypothetical protein
VRKTTRGRNIMLYGTHAGRFALGVILALAIGVSSGCSDQGVTEAKLDFEVDVTALDFGSQPTGCASDQVREFTVSNVGDAALEFTVGAISSVDQAFFFSGMQEEGSFSLEPAAELTFQVAFSPTHTGTNAGSIGVEPTNDPDPNEGRTLVLDGTGQGDADGDGLAAECGDCDDGDEDVYPGNGC